MVMPKIMIPFTHLSEENIAPAHFVRDFGSLKAVVAEAMLDGE